MSTRPTNVEKKLGPSGKKNESQNLDKSALYNNEINLPPLIY